jgi:hypothetical protein
MLSSCDKTLPLVGALHSPASLLHACKHACQRRCVAETASLIALPLRLQVISSAIGNEPPPGGVITALETSSMASTTMGVSVHTAAVVGLAKLSFCRHLVVGLICS